MPPPSLRRCGVLILLIYFFVAWCSMAAIPSAAPSFPLFAPPQNFSPAAVRFVHRMAYDRKAFAASLIDMAVKGYLTITEDARHLHADAHRQERRRGAACADRESRWPTQLFALDEVRSNSSRTTTATISDRDHRAQERAQERIRDVATSSPITPGSSAASRSSAVTGGRDRAAVRQCAGRRASCWSGFPAGRSARRSLLHRAYDAWIDVIRGPGSRILQFPRRDVLNGVRAAVRWWLGCRDFLFRPNPLRPWPRSRSSPAVSLAYIFYHLLKAPTLAGAKIFDQIDGFRLFLETAEKDRLRNAQSAESHAAGVREIPALRHRARLREPVEQEVRGRSRCGRARRRVQTYGSYTPIWYSGSSFGRLGTAGFSTALGASMASARHRLPSRRDRVRAAAAAGFPAAAVAAAGAAAGRSFCRDTPSVVFPLARFLI